MAKQRRQSGGLAISVLVPPLAAIAGWNQMGDPLHGTGLLVLLTLGVLAGGMMPAVLLSLGDLPKLLVPARWRAAYRRGRPREVQRSSYIPQYLRRVVLYTDRHRCVRCGNTESLQIDHILPWAGGGLAVLWNLMTLCGPCNRVKSNYSRDRDGYVHYRGFKGSENMAEAAAILAAERRRRLSPARWVRAGFALAA